MNAQHITFATTTSGSPHWFLTLWGRWVLANAFGEMLGLGVAALVGLGLALQFNETTGVAPALLTALVMILFGTLEGVVLGWAQWLVLRRYLDQLGGKTWIKATALGAFIAWLLGMLPSTVLSLTAHGESAPPAISDALQYGLAALMGLLLGVILGVPQWLVLRRYLRRAAWWLPANAVAWAVGMPVIFMGAGTLSPDRFNPVALVCGVLLICALAGAVVGALHGWALVWLLQGGGANDDAHDLS